MADTTGMFAGSMPEFYQRCMVPMNFAPHARILASKLAHMRAGEILEIAAGTGVVARELKALLPEAVRVIATDLLEQARLQPEADRIEWRQAGADALPFADKRFSAAICQFGVMFFPDRPASFREALRVLSPGSQYVFNVWDSLEHNVLGYTANQVIGRLFPSFRSSSHAVPFSYCDREIIRRDLASAGFTEPCFEVVSEFSRSPSARMAATAYLHGGVLRHEIEARGLGALERATNALCEALSNRFGTGEVQIPNKAIIVTTSRP